jgi:sugar phosphate isomerase/epimerase
MDDGRHYLESADLLENYSLAYSLHAPSRSINIACIHEPIRKASVEVIGNSFALAGEVDADIIIHPGYFTWEEEREKARQQFRKSLRNLTTIAEEYSVNFFIENMGNWNYFFLREPSEIDVLGEFGLALDVGHAHLNHCLDEFLALPFRHIHLHDNNGIEDTHSPVGSGTIDFTAVMQAVRRDNATPVIESTR